MLNWGAEWRGWYDSGGESGIEPPAEIKELFDLHEAAMRTVPSTMENEEAVGAIFDWYYENVPYFITAENVGYPLLVTEKLRNVPHSGLTIDATYIAVQYFLEE